MILVIKAGYCKDEGIHGCRYSQRMKRHFWRIQKSTLQSTIESGISAEFARERANEEDSVHKGRNWDI